MVSRRKYVYFYISARQELSGPARGRPGLDA